jgi:hypothetical protein
MGRIGTRVFHTQDPIVLELDGRKPSVWTESAKRCREASPDDQRKLEGCTISSEVGDFVCLKVSPMTGTNRFKVKGKLAPRYVGPFQILDRKGELLINLSYCCNYQRCMTCFTCLSSISAYEF